MLGRREESGGQGRQVARVGRAWSLEDPEETRERGRGKRRMQLIDSQSRQ